MKRALGVALVLAVAAATTASAFAQETPDSSSSSETDAAPPSVPLAVADVSDAGDGGDGGPSERDYAKHEENKGIAVAGRFDFGALGWSVGLGGMHLWEQADSYRGLGGIVWFEAGAEARMFLRKEDNHVMGGGGFGTGRISFMGDVMGMGLEATAGGAYLLDRMRALGSAGAFFGYLYIEFGYSYQIPIDGGDREGMIASHNLSLRITVPVHWYSKQMTRTYVPPRPNGPP